jgi:hypothetical protein
MVLQYFDGTWAGTNGCRLMPNDPFAEFPASVTLTPGAGGHLTSIAYWWEHPDDGPQDGLLVIGRSSGDGSLVAMWADSWHQKPAAMLLFGTDAPGAFLELEGDYGGGWRWRITVDATDAADLRMQMDNVIPAEQRPADMPSGAYPAMIFHGGRV